MDLRLFSNSLAWRLAISLNFAANAHCQDAFCFAGTGTLACLHQFERWIWLVQSLPLSIPFQGFVFTVSSKISCDISTVCGPLRCPGVLEFEDHPVVYCIYVPHLYSFIHWHLDCFHILATVNNTAINMALRFLFGIVIFVSFSYILKNEIAESCCSHIF